MTLRHPRFTGFLAVFALAAAAGAARLDLDTALVLGFDLAAAGFVLSCWPLWRRDHLGALQERAAEDDGGLALRTLVALLALGVVLVALVRLVAAGRQGDPAQFALVAGSLTLAWLFIHLLYAFHYAHRYHRLAQEHARGRGTGHATGHKPGQTPGAAPGGLEFPGGATPLFADFVYFAFVIGMTCQTADVNVTSTDMRRVAAGHGLIAFVFNLGVLALTVNVLAGLL